MRMLLLGFVFILCSCSESSIKAEMSKMMYQQVVIPYDKLDKRECSLFRNSLNCDSGFTLVVYVDGNHCVPCELSDLSLMEKSNSQDTMWQRLHKVYIFDARPENVSFLYMQLCNLRIEQDVFFDTCGVFRQTNPIIPDSKMYHTFVLDRNKNVTLVGNPFQNQQLKKVLSTIIEEIPIPHQ